MFPTSLIENRFLRKHTRSAIFRFSIIFTNFSGIAFLIRARIRPFNSTNLPKTAFFIADPARGVFCPKNPMFR